MGCLTELTRFLPPLKGWLPRCYRCEGIEGERLRELEHLLDNSDPVSADAFHNLVGDDPVLRRFERECASLADSSMIHCYEGELPDGSPAAYFDYSRIEHVFY